MTPTDLRQWRKGLGLSQEAAARALGCSRRRIIELEAGDRTIQHETALACAWITYHGPRDPWEPQQIGN